MRRLALAALTVLALAGCGGGQLESEWSGPPKPAADGSLGAKAFDDYLDEYEDYATSPEALATEFLRLDEQTAASRTLATTGAPEGGGDRATVTATLAGLPDDSVEAARYVLVVAKGKGGWRLDSAIRSQRCRAGRGHRDFSAEPCV
jgi:hypothetical protein